MAETSQDHEVLIIGGGIAGAALAATLARGGLDVLVLEASETYPDRVRGEVVSVWGVKEVQRLGLTDPLLAAGGQFVPRLIGYDEIVAPEEAEAGQLDLSTMIEGVPGFIHIAHPAHCQALLDAAGAAGARIVRGAQIDEVEAGRSAGVRFHVGDQAFSSRAKLLVGADGRTSAAREALGFPLAAGRPRGHMCGMLAEAEGWAPDVFSTGTEGDLCYFIIPLAGGRARLYGFWSLDQQRRFAGEGGQAALLSAFRLECCPKSRAVAEGRPAGPLAIFLNNESLVVEPFRQGAVLLGDAAGWTDPLIGCGLSSAYRDVRLVSEALLAGDWSAGAFADYAREREERHRRLMVISAFVTELACSFGPAARARRIRYAERVAADPANGALARATACGPESQPPEVFTAEFSARVLA